MRKATDHAERLNERASHRDDAIVRSCGNDEPQEASGNDLPLRKQRNNKVEHGPGWRFPAGYYGLQSAIALVGTVAAPAGDGALGTAGGFVYQMPVMRHIPSLTKFGVRLKVQNAATLANVGGIRIKVFMEGIGIKELWSLLLATVVSKLSLIDLNAEMPTRAKAIGHAERLNERASHVDDAIVRSDRNKNYQKQAEMTCSALAA